MKTWFDFHLQKKCRNYKCDYRYDSDADLSRIDSCTFCHRENGLYKCAQAVPLLCSMVITKGKDDNGNIHTEYGQLLEA
jgi:hypothetical protein